MSGKRRRRIDGWSAFLGWFLVGALLGFGFAAALSVGGVALPFVLLLGGLMIWARPPASSVLGLVAGVGALILFIGILHIGDTACAESGFADSSTVAEGDDSCGGLDARPWLAVGATALAAGSGLFAVAEYKGSKVNQGSP
ncbi:MAG: hypothetical protein BMS9Abin07_2019 [Acidimicrobiia bacterium]|nr:MAG: hypothetical protein BMS9Abin07_2019 [Acidimicrobiia bacterium]